jgi:glucose-1-phosphate thymidylyltransferase
MGARRLHGAATLRCRSNELAVPDPHKVIILARGLGTRMRATAGAPALTPDQAAAADVGMKAMIPIGRPFLDYSLSALADAGFDDVCLVIGPEHAAIRAHYTHVVRPVRLTLRFAIQEKPLGTADAVLSAREFVGDDGFLVVNSDNYYPPGVLSELRRQPPPALPAFSRAGLLQDGQIPAERIARYALLDISQGGVLRRIVEKPDPATYAALADAPVSMNCWLLTPAIFEACKRVPPSARGELELPLAVQFAIAELGMQFNTFPTDASVMDLSQRSDIPQVARRLAELDVRL